MRLDSPLLENWFNTYQPGALHQLGGTMIEPVPGERLAAHLPSDWSPTLIETGYSSTPGSETLRTLLSAAYGVPADHVILTSGATGANAAALFALLDPGSNVVLQDPLYYQFAGLAAGLGVEVRRWQLPADPTSEPDLDRLNALLDDRTRLVVLNSPHNPTGRILSERALLAIANRVEALPDCYLLVDEIYHGVTPTGVPSVVSLTERGIAVNSLSKRWSLPGLRLGWAACADRAVAARLLAWHEHTTCSVSRLSEQMLEWLWPKRIALWAEHQEIAQRNRDLFAAWLATVAEVLHGQLPPAGVMTLVWPRDGKDDQALSKALRQDHGVFVVPGSYVGYPGSLRIGFGHRNAEILQGALTQLGQALGMGQGVPA